MDTRRWLSILFAAALCAAMAGCGVVANAVFDYPDRCRDNCHDTYQACLEQIGTPDANHYCLTQRNRCVDDC